MISSELRKKTIFFLLSTAIIILILLIIPHEDNIKSYLMHYLDLTITSEGKIIKNDGSMTSQLSETILSVITNLVHIIKIILGMALVVIAVRFVNYLVFNLVLRNASQNEIASLVRTILSVIVCIVAFFIIFQSQYPAVQLAPLFTGSTILGIVVGLALQDTLGNLFAGIALQADQPFQVGDVINIQSRWTGVVESVSWRGVKLRTFQNKIVVISNSSLGKEFIEVAPRENLNARLVFFNTLYANSPATTAHVIREAVRQCENVSAKIRPIVRIRNLGDNGIDWEVKYWLEDYTKFNDSDALIRERIWYTFQREELEFAYPTRTLHIETKTQEDAFVETDSDVLDLINDIPLFEPLTEAEIESIARASNLRVFAPKEKIVRRGQKGNSMFVIYRGTVTVQIREDNKIKTLRKLKKGEFFGEMALFTGEPRTATVVADEETEVLEIKHFCLKPIIEANPQLVESFGKIIERRRAALNKLSETDETDAQTDKTGVFTSIRKFFGLRNKTQNTEE